MKEEKIPSLTEKIRIFALGGLDEDGKNLFCVEVDQSIYVIEAGIKFPDNKESLGIEFIIQWKIKIVSQVFLLRMDTMMLWELYHIY